MDARACAALPHVISQIEKFAHITIEMHGRVSIVQIIERWVIYDDGTAVITVHDATDPLRGFQDENFDAERSAHLHHFVEQLADFAESHVA